MTTRDKQLQRCVLAAKKAGSPKDQVQLLMEYAGYIPYPWQWQFHAAARSADHDDGPTEICLGGARGPGKSHAVLSQAALDDCQRVEGLKVLFLRQTGLSAQESFDDLIHKAVKGRAEYRKSKNSLRFVNGSRIILGGFKNESDIDKYIGVEYDIIIVEELTQLTKEKYTKLKGSLRTSKPGWRPRMYTTTNPGGIGHAWVLEYFVIPFREDRQRETRFIPSTYKQNPALNKGYIIYLESIGGDLGKAWREGDWDLFAGQYFSEWRFDLHVVNPFKIPDNWRKLRSIDPSGRNGITSAHWYAIDPDGDVWVYREYYYGVGVPLPDGTKVEIGRDYDEHAKKIHGLSKNGDEAEKYYYSVIDSAAFAKAGYSETAEEIYRREGVDDLIPAAKERVIGWNAVHTYLRHDKTHRPKLHVFKNCVNMIRTIPLLQHDAKVPEDVDTNGEDHAADELRYILRTLRELKATKAETLVEQRLRAIREAEAQAGFDYSRK